MSNITGQETKVYLIGFINTETLKLERVQTATQYPVAQNFKYFQVELHRAYANSPELAMKELEKQVANKLYFGWLDDLMKQQDLWL